MGVTFSALYSNMPNSEQNVEGCDAIGFDSSIEVWFIKKFSLNTGSVSERKIIRPRFYKKLNLAELGKLKKIFIIVYSTLTHSPVSELAEYYKIHP